MGLAQLIRWQWDGYVHYHRARTDLILHILGVPVFLVGNFTVVMASLRTSISRAVVGFAGMASAIVVQGRGHKLEEMPPEPFGGIGNVAARIFLEQWVTFPRFVPSGGWLRALRASAN